MLEAQATPLHAKSTRRNSPRASLPAVGPLAVATLGVLQLPLVYSVAGEELSHGAKAKADAPGNATRYVPLAKICTKSLLRSGPSVAAAAAERSMSAMLASSIIIACLRRIVTGQDCSTCWGQF